LYPVLQEVNSRTPPFSPGDKGRIPGVSPQSLPTISILVNYSPIILTLTENRAHKNVFLGNMKLSKVNNIIRRVRIPFRMSCSAESYEMSNAEKNCKFTAGTSSVCKAF
jgi:hypothetical protein